MKEVMNTLRNYELPGCGSVMIDFFVRRAIINVESNKDFNKIVRSDQILHTP
jgi:hypothetical protein